MGTSLLINIRGQLATSMHSVQETALSGSKPLLLSCVSDWPAYLSIRCDRTYKAITCRPRMEELKPSC